MRPSKRLWVVFCVLCIVLAITLTLLAQTTLTSFGLSDSEVKSHVVSAIINGDLPFYPSRTAYKSASGSTRAALVRNVLTVIKTYTESAAFQSEYARHRAEAKPTQAAGTGSADDQYAKYLAQQQKSIDDMKANIAKMPPETRAQMAIVIKQLEDNFQKQKNDPQTAATMKQALAGQAENSQKQYQQELAKYEQRHPADPKVLIANRLHQFLDLTKDMHWDAKLVPAGGGAMRFADPQLESRSDQWKLCFRAGKDAVDAARTFAMEWLKQLGK